MIRVKMSTNSPAWPFLKQTPGEKGIWGDCQFFVDEDVRECDFWVVYDDVMKAEVALCPPENTLLITGEPPSVKTYHPRFLAQFARVVTCQRDLKHPHLIFSQQGLPWHIQTKSYDELKQGDPVKSRPISIISSDKVFTEGHRKRLEFTQSLKSRLGDGIDYFGKGVRTAKYDTTAPYEYSVVIENSAVPDYWTEKLADAFLLGAYPFYAGCPNVLSYFPADALTLIDLSDVEGALTTIQSAMRRGAYEATQQQRQAAKTLVLDEYNIFAVLDKMFRASPPSAAKQMTHIRPERQASITILSKMKAHAKKYLR